MLLAAVRRTIRRHQMVPRGGRVAVALSGGPDSVALLHLMRELERSGDVILAGIAHFNHQLREAAAEDEQFCRDLAAALDLPIAVGSADVRTAARESKQSIEDTARRLRYAFLHQASASFGADAIAVGHTRDDQAETVLLRMVRGAGTRGLASIRPRAGSVVRPLIDVSRAELRAFATEREFPFREDETNADVTIPRNRVRHELLPYLRREFSPNIVEVLAREAALARDDDERLQNEAIDLATSIVLTNTQTAPFGEGVVVDAGGLNALHPALASRVARIALGHLGADRFVGFDHVQRFLEFVRDGRTGSSLSLPGQRVRMLRAPAQPHERLVILEPVSPRLETSQAGAVFQFPLSIPGEVVLARQGWTVSADWAGAEDPRSPRGLTALVKGLNGPLAVRSRRPGDRFSPPGLGGRARKLQDFLVDRKIARSDRDALPLVVDRDDRIVWIVGHAVAEGFRAVTPSPGVILLKARHLGGEV
jgi:tRNA(Ile)-lysidine synthase